MYLNVDLGSIHLPLPKELEFVLSAPSILTRYRRPFLPFFFAFIPIFLAKKRHVLVVSLSACAHVRSRGAYTLPKLYHFRFTLFGR